MARNQKKWQPNRASPYQPAAEPPGLSVHTVLTVRTATTTLLAVQVMPTLPHNEDIELGFTSSYFILFLLFFFPFRRSLARFVSYGISVTSQTNRRVRIVCIANMIYSFSSLWRKRERERGAWVRFRELEYHVTEAIKGQSRFRSCTYRELITQAGKSS